MDAHLFPGSGGEGDPIVGYDLKNVAYAGGIQNSNVVLSSPTNNGQTWGTPVIVTTPLLGSLADKPWLEVDTNSASPFVNALYISVTQFDGSSDSEILFRIPATEENLDHESSGH